MGGRVVGVRVEFYGAVSRCRTGQGERDNYVI